MGRSRPILVCIRFRKTVRNKSCQGRSPIKCAADGAAQALLARAGRWSRWVGAHGPSAVARFPCQQFLRGRIRCRAQAIAPRRQCRKPRRIDAAIRNMSCGLSHRPSIRWLAALRAAKPGAITRMWNLWRSQTQLAANHHFFRIVDVVPFRQIAMGNTIFIRDAPQGVALDNHIRTIATFPGGVACHCRRGVSRCRRVGHRHCRSRCRRRFHCRGDYRSLCAGWRFGDGRGGARIGLDYGCRRDGCGGFFIACSQQWNASECDE